MDSNVIFVLSCSCQSVWNASNLSFSDQCLEDIVSSHNLEDGVCERTTDCLVIDSGTSRLEWLVKVLSGGLTSLHRHWIESERRNHSGEARVYHGNDEANLLRVGCHESSVQSTILKFNCVADSVVLGVISCCDFSCVAGLVSNWSTIWDSPSECLN